MGSSRQLSGRESALVHEVAAAANSPAEPAQPAQLTVMEGDQRSAAAAWQTAVIVVDLQAFEDVRMVSGHLSAERMAADATHRLRALLRAGDRLRLLGDDRFGIAIGITDENQVEALRRRIEATLSDVPLPRRARAVRPVIRTATGGAVAADPEMAALVAGFQPAPLRKAG